MRQTLQQRAENLIAGRYQVFNQVDLNQYQLTDIPIVIAHNGFNHFTPTKPLKTDKIIAMRNGQIYQSAVLMRYMLRRGINSHLTEAQNESWHIMNDALLKGMWAFAPEDPVMRKEYEGGIIEQMVKSFPPRPPHLGPASYTVIGDQQNVQQRTSEEPDVHVSTPRATSPSPAGSTSSTSQTTAPGQRPHPAATTSATSATSATSGSSATSATPVSVSDTVMPKKKKPPKMHQCPECPRIFPRTDHLRQHIDSKHRQGKWVCEQCGKSLSFERGLKAHIKSQHKKEPNFKCSVEDCDYTSTTKALLEHHTATKHSEQEYPCDICGKKCSSLAAVKDHKRRGYDCAETVKWNCPKEDCGARCRTQRTQRHHVKQHHKELVPMLADPTDSMQEEEDEKERQRKKKRKATRTKVSPRSAKPPTGRPKGNQRRDDSDDDTTRRTTEATVEKTDATTQRVEFVESDDLVVQHVEFEDFDTDEEIVIYQLPGEEVERDVASDESPLPGEEHLLTPMQADSVESVDQTANITQTGIVTEPEDPEEAVIREATRLRELEKAQQDEERRKKEEAEERELAAKAIEEGKALKLQAEAQAAKDAKLQEEKKRKDKAKARRAREDAAKRAYQETLFQVEPEVRQSSKDQEQEKQNSPAKPIQQEDTVPRRTAQQVADWMTKRTLTAEEKEEKRLQDEKRREKESDEKKETIRKTREKFAAEDKAQAQAAAEARKIKKQQEEKKQAELQAFEEMKRQRKKADFERKKSQLLAQGTVDIPTAEKQRKIHKRRVSSLFQGKATAAKVKDSGTRTKTSSTVTPPVTPISLPSSPATPTTQSAPVTPTAPGEQSRPIFSFDVPKRRRAFLPSDSEDDEQEKRQASLEHEDQPAPKAIVLTESEKEMLGMRKSQSAIVKIIRRPSPPTQAIQTTEAIISPSASTSTSTAVTTTQASSTAVAAQVQPPAQGKTWEKLTKLTTVLKCNICGKKFHPPNRKAKLLTHLREKHNQTHL